MTSPLGVGLVGCGRIAHMFHLPILADTDEAARDTAVRLAYGAIGVRDVDELLAVPGVDAVVVCLPSQGPRGPGFRLTMTACHPGSTPARRPFVARQYDSPPDITIDFDTVYVATLNTTQGAITIELDAARAPQTVNNFVHLAHDGYYNGVIFHRVVPGFVIQGGDPTGRGSGGPGYKFRDEIEGEGRYTRGTVAMANTGPNTNGSQFFICLGDLGLPHSYTIFGTVTAGMEAVDSVAALPRKGERPTDEALIESVEITER